MNPLPVHIYKPEEVELIIFGEGVNSRLYLIIFAFLSRGAKPNSSKGHLPLSLSNSA